MIPTAPKDRVQIVFDRTPADNMMLNASILLDNVELGVIYGNTRPTAEDVRRDAETAKYFIIAALDRLSLETA